MTALTIFEDGSLSDVDAETLRTALPGSRVVRREEMDAQVRPRLSSHPNCLELRDKNAFGLKLLDAAMLTESGTIFFDSDVMFFKPFTCESLVPYQASHFIFMGDERQGYSARIFGLFRIIWKHKLTLPSRVNTGCWSYPSHLYDLDFIEWFLTLPEFRRFPQLIEQTCWAAMAGQSKRDVMILDRKQIYCATDKLKIREQTISVHFADYHKKRVAEFAPFSENQSSEEITSFHLVPASRLTFFKMLMNSVKNRWRRLWL